MARPTNDPRDPSRMSTARTIKVGLAAPTCPHDHWTEDIVTSRDERISVRNSHGSGPDGASLFPRVPGRPAASAHERAHRVPHAAPTRAHGLV